MKGQYVLLGADFLLKNKEWALEAIRDKLDMATEANTKTGQLDNKVYSTLSECDISLNTMRDTIRNRFHSIFSDDLENVEACKYVKHKIATTEKYPLAQKNCQIPVHWQVEIEK
ncbi:MAG: hypothetical protein ACRDDF_01695 [Aeromonas sp.]